MSRIAIFGAQTAKPGQVDALLARIVTHARLSREEPGCIRFDVAVGREDPDTVHFYEIWADPAALDVHANTDRIKAFRAEVKELVAERRVAICTLQDSPDA